MSVTTRLSDVEAYILDLDGVITDTASLHARAWKRTFDDFLGSRDGNGGEDLRPFDEVEDYRRYVDGKPRYDGVRSFLESRGIEPASDTVHGLGDRKNALFHELLSEGGIEVYEDAVRAVNRWKRRGGKVAVVSSSRNCSEVLKTAKLADLFDVQVDGLTLEELGLSGKPAPDAFVEAARRLGVAPERAAVFEDAVSGVEAGAAGDFALVVGIDRSGDAKSALLEHGADVVIQSFEAISPPERLDKDACLEEVRRTLDDNRRLALFLDYDGTLTPIVASPEDAWLSDAMRGILDALATKLPVAIVSGRDREDVERRVGLSSIFYAGSHGFDISGPGGFRKELEEGKDCIPSLDDAERELQRRLDRPHLERKRYALAVHYRNLPEKDVPEIKRVVDDVVSGFPKLRSTGGKKIVEVRPAVDWDKGRAVRWLLEALEMSFDDTLPVYLGDDVTDEDAFEVLAEGGLGIVVGDFPADTAARGHLEDVSEVERFLSDLVELYENGR